ncbi:sigma-54 interaction domain-containing protein [Thauera aromatica]|uniref:Sensory histidine kinase n=1 Tax=Thauera aromatica K172 TaxID=44139 RepID=A0A2R4BRY7_THAAR|nr:sigma-54 dependent transcriptional regulator [Thauera aromatica]AVR90040.1 Putative sensory histidine kinase [Thauera aromatica K172]
MSDFLMSSSFLNSLEEGVLLLDAQLGILANNEAASAMLQRESRELVGRPCPSLFPAMPCAHHCRTSGLCTLTPDDGEERKIQDVLIKNADGRERALRVWAMRVPHNAAGVHCTIILRDCSRERELEAEVREHWQLGGLTGRSVQMQDLYQKILRAAASDASVLISGESGVGKELAARALHDNSPRAGGPYVAVHCAALPETLQETELFGHSRGAFSGALTARTGRFEAAHGGTLFLDEIGEISPATQVKLLRVLQEREIVRVGENEARKVDVRIIAATHRDLKAMIAQGLFREDLYYRLCVLPLHIPALRERREDIPLLVGNMLATLAARYARPPLRLSPEAMRRLEAFDWPGNARQLFNCLEYAVVQSDGALIPPESLPPELAALSAAAPAADSAPIRPPPAKPLTRYYAPPPSADEERAAIRDALRAAGGNKAEAARRLGISRTTLWKRLARYPELDSAR